MQILWSGVLLLHHLMVISKYYLQFTVVHMNIVSQVEKKITGHKMNRQSKTDTSIKLQERKLFLFIC